MADGGGVSIDRSQGSKPPGPRKLRARRILRRLMLPPLIGVLGFGLLIVVWILLAPRI